MRCVIQRVSEASVTIEGQVKGRIGRGLLLLVGIHATDTRTQVDWMVRKAAQLRIFEDGDGKMNRSIADAEGSFLVISQFTLYGDARKGNRPSFIEAARPGTAIPLYEAFVEGLRQESGLTVETGEFGADMKVSLVNDGPVTILLEI
jgi:D-tyrosyl-tRNA(Tyr) deacylase